MPHLELIHVTKNFGPTKAVVDLNLDVERGQILSILGPSGCGKTTTLRMIAGLETPTSGSILSNGRDVTRVAAKDRNIGMVFQNYALFPHLDVYENVAFGLKTRRVGKTETARRVTRALESVRMQNYERRQVHQLSGGQQQRIALARALAIEPELLLLDEPLSNLDPSLREDLRDQIREIIRELEVTTVFVTHDQQEAFGLADRIAIMNAGVCQQTGVPEDVYDRPANAFVAGFVGKANLIPVPDGFLFVRPENVRLSARRGGQGGSAPPALLSFPSGVKSDTSIELSFEALVEKVVFEGAIVNYTLRSNGSSIAARTFHHGRKPYPSGESVTITIDGDSYHIIPRQ